MASFSLLSPRALLRPARCHLAHAALPTRLTGVQGVRLRCAHQLSSPPRLVMKQPGGASTRWKQNQQEGRSGESDGGPHEQQIPKTKKRRTWLRVLGLIGIYHVQSVLFPAEVPMPTWLFPDYLPLYALGAFLLATTPLVRGVHLVEVICASAAINCIQSLVSYYLRALLLEVAHEPGGSVIYDAQRDCFFMPDIVGAMTNHDVVMVRHPRAPAGLLDQLLSRTDQQRKTNMLIEHERGHVRTRNINILCSAYLLVVARLAMQRAARSVGVLAAGAVVLPLYVVVATGWSWVRELLADTNVGPALAPAILETTGCRAHVGLLGGRAVCEEEEYMKRRGGLGLTSHPPLAMRYAAMTKGARVAACLLPAEGMCRVLTADVAVAGVKQRYLDDLVAQLKEEGARQRHLDNRLAHLEEPGVPEGDGRPVSITQVGRPRRAAADEGTNGQAGKGGAQMGGPVVVRIPIVDKNRRQE